MADKMEATFFTNQARSSGARKRLMLKTTKLFLMDNIAIKLSFGQTTVFPPRLVCQRHYRVSRDLIRSAYLWDSCGAAKVNMAIISISYLHNTVCRLKAVKDTASRALKHVFTPLKDLQNFFEQNENLYPHLNMTPLLILLKTESAEVKVSLERNPFNLHTGTMS